MLSQKDRDFQAHIVNLEKLVPRNNFYRRLETKLDPGNYDVWSYEGQAGEILTITVLADNPAPPDMNVTNPVQNELMDAWIVVYAPDGQYLVQNNDISDEDLNSRIENMDVL